MFFDINLKKLSKQIIAICALSFLRLGEHKLPKREVMGSKISNL